MGYEHFLTKQDPNGFSDADRSEMVGYLDRLPHLRWKGAWLLIPDPEKRAARAAQLESFGDINLELSSSVRMVDNEVWLTSVGDRRGDTLLKEFAAWCMSRWPCNLEYFGRKIEPEELVLED
jgi:hypothetical protein